MSLNTAVASRISLLDRKEPSACYYCYYYYYYYYYYYDDDDDDDDDYDDDDDDRFTALLDLVWEMRP